MTEPTKRPYASITDTWHGGMARATAIAWGVSVVAAQTVYEAVEYDDGTRQVIWNDGHIETLGKGS